jgi:cytochrome P450
MIFVTCLIDEEYIMPAVPTLPPMTRREQLRILWNPVLFFQRPHLYQPEIARFSMGDTSLYFLTHPHLIEEVLVTKHKYFQKDAFIKHTSHGVFGNGLLANDGDFWLKQRRLAQPAFHRQRITSYGDIIATLTQAALTNMPRGTYFNINTFLMDMTLEIVTTAMFGNIARESRSTISQALETILNHFGVRSIPERLTEAITRRPITSETRYQQATYDLDQAIQAIVDARRQSPGQYTDLLQMLLDARDDDDNGMSAQQLLDECKTMILAGHETTALALTWSMWLLLKHPQVLHKLTQEVKSVLGNRLPSMSDIAALPYTEQVIRESMRLYPPAYNISRESLQEVDLGGYHIPAHHEVSMSQFAIHRDARWYDNPNAFIPERWNEAFKATLPKFAYFPFGGGPRLCIGQQFAMLEASIILAMLVRHGTWRLHPWQLISLQTSITLRPRYGIWVAVE